MYMSADKYLFSVTTMEVINGRRLGELKPDEDGYYLHPAAVINHHTENDTFYVPEIFLQQLTDPGNIFRKNLERGNLFGEADHPDVPGTMADVPRLLRVAQDRVSHHIKEVKTIPLEEVPGAYLILMRVKPHGKYGPQLEESLRAKYVNTTFSLRSIIRESLDPRKNLRVRKILQLVTFDWVTVPGSPEAAKRYSNLGVENYSRVLTADMFRTAAYDYGMAAGLESYSESAVKSLLGELEIKLNTENYELTGYKNPGDVNFIDRSTGDRRSIAHVGLRMKGGII
jgi:hypothetical protein